MGEGFNLFDRVAAELVADHLKFFIKTRGTKHHVGFLLLHQLNKAQASSLCVAVLGELHDLWGHEGAHIFLIQAKILQAQNLSLVHLNAAIDLPEVFAKGDLVHQTFNFAKLTF